jgi:hypothetical protein
MEQNAGDVSACRITRGAKSQKEAQMPGITMFSEMAGVLANRSVYAGW